MGMKNVSKYTISIFGAVVQIHGLYQMLYREHFVCEVTLVYIASHRTALMTSTCTQAPATC